MLSPAAKIAGGRGKPLDSGTRHQRDGGEPSVLRVVGYTNLSHWAEIFVVHHLHSRWKNDAEHLLTITMTTIAGARMVVVVGTVAPLPDHVEVEIWNMKICGWGARTPPPLHTRSNARGRSESNLGEEHPTPLQSTSLTPTEHCDVEKKRPPLFVRGCIDLWNLPLTYVVLHQGQHSRK